ncbi:RNA-guided endonuclease TnpB family protein, partial [Candidatus Chlorohelix sp.]|uniref:RNA-guided endonuclease TnpB family protein n=1 Tax=Candidatus Chlorohelix sp. TaxID=3139201 RepID=UPI003063EFC8
MLTRKAYKYRLFPTKTQATALEQTLRLCPVVGIDVGLEHFANLSTGEQVTNPRFFRKSEKRLAKAQKRLAKIPKNSPMRRKFRKPVSLAFRKVRNQRLDFAHKLSHKISNTYSLIAVEDLQVKNLSKRAKPKEDESNPGHYLPNGASAKSGLNKSVNDAGWSLFLNLLEYKVANTGSKLIRVDPRYTSQICPECGAIAKKELSVRWHSCPCGCEMHRDTAAALVILARGLSG